MRRAPDPPQPLPDFGPSQVAELDAEGAAVGEGGVARARAGEIGVDVDDAPDIADQDEGRAFVLLG
jgi:hypothetical protein